MAKRKWNFRCLLIGVVTGEEGIFIVLKSVIF